MNATSWRLSARSVLPVRSSGLRLPRIDDLDTGGIECAGIGRRDDKRFIASDTTLVSRTTIQSSSAWPARLSGDKIAQVFMTEYPSIETRSILWFYEPPFLKGTAASQGKNGQIEFSAPAIQHLKATQGEANRAA